MARKNGPKYPKTTSDLSPLSGAMRKPINLPQPSIEGIKQVLRHGTEQVLKHSPFVSPASRQAIHSRAATAYGATLEQVGQIAEHMHNQRERADYQSLKQTPVDHALCGRLAAHLGVSRREVGSIAVAMLWRELGMDADQEGSADLS
jgi:hypothetical protein